MHQVAAFAHGEPGFLGSRFLINRRLWERKGRFRGPLIYITGGKSNESTNTCLYVGLCGRSHCLGRVG